MIKYCTEQLSQPLQATLTTVTLRAEMEYRLRLVVDMSLRLTSTLKLMLAMPGGSKDPAWIDPANGGTTGTAGWPPIGDGGQFKAVFEGNDKIISNLYINLTSGYYTGLFGYCEREP